MVLKIWLDDIRPPPDNSWKWAKSVFEATGEKFLGDNILATQKEIIISFDHNLGENPIAVQAIKDNPYLEGRINTLMATGYDLAKIIESLAAQGKIYNISHWEIHSANPIGRKNIRQAMESFERIRSKRENSSGSPL